MSGHVSTASNSAQHPSSALGSQSNIAFAQVRLPLRGTMLTKQRSHRPRGHISNRVRRNALISLSLTPQARLVEINGQVLARSCRPVERALVHLWHANERGEYDNAVSGIGNTSLPDR